MRVLRKLYRDLTHMILLMIHSHFLQQSHLIRKCIKKFWPVSGEKKQGAIFINHCSE